MSDEQGGVIIILTILISRKDKGRKKKIRKEGRKENR